MSKFEALKQFEPYANIECLNLPQSNQILVVRLDIEKYGVDTAYDIYENISNYLPSGTLVMGLPKDIEFETWDIDEIDAAIREL